MRIEAECPDVRRVIVVVLDGVRPDAIDAFDMVNLRRLMTIGAASRAGTTVSPSITTAAMTSLLTGVSPATHGIRADRFRLPWTTSLSPIAGLLAKHGYTSSAFMAELPTLLRGLASRVGQKLGFGSLRATGRSATEVLFAARSTVRAQRNGLIVLHWPDADRAGHSHGWMSEVYADACSRLDDMLGLLTAFANVPSDPRTVLIALADHGGGGVSPNDHDAEHPINRTIPIVIAGGAVGACELDAPRLLDVAPTILWALGVGVPPSFEGRALHEAFLALEAPETAVA